MEQARLLDAHIQLRRMYNLLGEVLDISRQLAEALDRNDSMSAQMLLSMRGEPIAQLNDTRAIIKRQIDATPDEEREHFRALLNGVDAAVPEERGIADQVAANARLLKQVQELDKALSAKITREDSVYGR